MREYSETGAVNLAEKFYKEKIVHGLIENYWTAKDPRPSNKTSNSITACLDTSKKWKKYFKANFSHSFQDVRKPNFENMDVLCGELKNLLPENDTEEIESILPVLITSYIQNKKGNDGFAQRLIDEGFDKNFDYHKKVEIFIPQRWEKRYSSLKATDCKESGAKRIFPMFFNAVMFLFFLLKAEKPCKIGLSFYIYECLTGYLGLLSSQAETIISELDQLYSRGDFTVDYSGDRRIVKYARSLLRDFKNIPNPAEEEIPAFDNDPKIVKKLDYPLSVYTFASRVGSSLDPEFIPDDIISVLNGKDIVKYAYFLDTDFADGQGGIVDEMPKETQECLEEYHFEKFGPGK